MNIGPMRIEHQLNGDAAGTGSFHIGWSWKPWARRRAIADLRSLSPNIVEVSEGDPDPARRRASVRLEFYGPNATARSIEAANAVRAILGR